MPIWNLVNVPAIVADVVDNQNPKYVRAKQGIKGLAQIMQLVSGAGVVVGAVALFFGFTQGNAAVVLLVAVPLVYFCYNMYRISENIAEVAENPHLYIENNISSLIGCPKKPDIPKLETCLKKNTFCFEIFVRMIVGYLFSSKPNQLNSKPKR
ncbi:MAG TPA: hypothetical protein VMR37_00270 [Rhabdochlamydiaceae bacterium]|jgi:hypothetical protein|nr:hypothetical protein [Rhabdochlamydiaceae bacterium]